MRKKLTKQGNSLSIVIDKPILRLLNIDEKTDIELTLLGDGLFIRPAGTKRSLSKKEKMTLVEQVADEVMDEYEEAFKKLAK